MIKVKALVAVTIPSGQVSLSKEQADRRMSCLLKGKGNSYDVLQPIQMKAGEEFGIDSINKEQESMFEVIKTVAPEV